ncbi:alpha/beta fold hydrolase [Pseudoduganella guangdongensis]|uniref:alpha/beta fold hydrolase n=1 Tax=Pseudoduganella guangdongensis TaxID=2692179 RepID=UPI0019289465|nr:alpha/beta hydrolase [Pseudoduganella guangdongensis]
MKTINTFALTLALIGSAAAPLDIARAADIKPTVILVHGAFADSASWNGVAAKLRGDGYNVIGAANPLRSVQGDASAVANIVKSVKGPVVLVGHSYGGAVISAAANGLANVKSLVYVAAFAPDQGETALELSGRYPGGTLGGALAEPVALANGGKDFYIQQDKFHQQFAADVPKAQAELMAMGQRPIAEAALTEAAGAPAWKNLPSYFIYGTADKNIPAAALGFMADRAKSRKTIKVAGASHVVMTSHPAAVAKLIEEAAQAK